MSSVTPYRPEPTVLNESLMEGHNWFINQFVEIPQIQTLSASYLFLAKAGLMVPPFENSGS
jgi:hypothetical protein